MTQAYLNGHSAMLSFVLVEEVSVGEVVVRRDDRDFRPGNFFSLSRSSLSDICVSFLSPVVLGKSKAVPGVLGVLLALPKLANAPLPSPNDADAPLLVGEGTT